jgi:uncharacterized protein with NAD-binding domain and iron-sulfur cluster
MTDSDQPTRVVVLGGGIGAICTAFWLTSTPALRQRYAVSVYTHGWRLGGKCASGRDATQGDRIQEHGLHLLMGWYETAFQTMRACYAEWNTQPDNPFRTWRDAFTPLRQVTLTQQVPDTPAGSWQIWNIPFPQLPGSPGDPADDFVDDVVHRVLGWLREFVWHELSLPAHVLPDLGPLVGAHETAQRVASLPPTQRSGLYEEILGLLVEFQKGFQKYAEPLLELFPSEGYKICAFTDFALALLIGFIRDVLPDWDAGIQKLDELEFRAWLLSAGANPKFTGFAPVRVLYDLAFAYENGDSSSIEHGKIAAGAGLRALLRMTFGYKDAPLWKMNAGMGDTIFTPLYQVLRQRGVDVHFFHRVTNLGVAADGRSIESIALYRQANLVNGYDPLVPVEVNGRVLPCWPSHPKWDAIVGGEGIAADAWDLESMWCTYRAAKDPDVTLRHGVDFDLVVLGIPPAALKDIGAELLAPGKCPSIRAMYDNTRSVSTQAAQLWLKPDVADLGWTLGPTVLSAYADPFRSWGEMSHLLPMETWHWPAAVPGSCEYFCGTRVAPAALPPYGDRDFLRQQTDQVRDGFGEWLQANAARLWPKAAVNGKGFNRDLLASEYYRVNLDPSEMYVQSFPGSVKFRLSPGNSGVDNLILAGDWTKGSVDGGCAEGAFESGKLAAEAICKQTLDLPLERLPKFISYKGCGEVDFAAPLIATDDLLYAFALESNPTNVQALVDATLAAPAKGEIEYRVLGNHVLLVFQHCGHFSSPAGIGWAEDRETAIMVPLIEKRIGALSPPRLVLWMPYLTIDVGLGMITGRDVWGYNKSLGTTTMPNGPTDPAIFNNQTLVFDTFAPQTQAQVQTLIEVTRADAAALGALQPKWGDGAAVLAEINTALGPWKIVGDVELGLDLLGLMLERDIPVINLKEMRDTRYTHLAVYQALVETMLVVSKFTSAGMLDGTYTVKIRQCDSHRIGQDFGLPSGGVAPGQFFTVSSKLAFWVKLDFNAPIGRTVWSAR